MIDPAKPLHVPNTLPQVSEFGGFFGRNRPWGLFSEDSLYRYLLAWPTGEPNDRIVLGCFANPSTATPDVLDPTLRRFRNYASAWGYGWFWVVNVRAWRETDPKKVPEDPKAVGPENAAVIRAAAAAAHLVVCGWGKLGGAQGLATLDLIRESGKEPHALKLNDDGSPAHPLYLNSNLMPFPMEKK